MASGKPLLGLALLAIIGLGAYGVARSLTAPPPPLPPELPAPPDPLSRLEAAEKLPASPPAQGTFHKILEARAGAAGTLLPREPIVPQDAERAARWKQVEFQYFSALWKWKKDHGP